MQVTPFGLQILDPNWLLGTAATAPSVRIVAAADEGAFARGDVVMETDAVISGVAVVTSPLIVAPGGGRLKLGAKPLIVVAVAPAGPSLAGISPVLPAGPKGTNGQVWVIPAGNREFLIAGDASTPARAELPGAGNPPLTLHEGNIGDGYLFARLRYGAPAGGVSGTTLDGSSFTDAHGTGQCVPGGHGELHVLGLANGSQFGPHALYRVRFRNLV
ncbi:MAG: hypothetical protein JF567_09605 [Xanthomonadales bacterium]|jgi:hypothetical protein|nr:hypothetical protein [Xanthomonadales bacterium]